MGRRIEVELTSSRDDGSWTWRAAGARQPKGELIGSLLYEGAKVGDVVKVEAEFHVDGIEVIEVFAPKRKKERTDLLELKSRQWRDDELITTQRVSRDERRGGRRGRNRDRDGRPRPKGGGSGRRSDSRRDRHDPVADAPTRPKPKRLRPKRAHRDALLTEVAEEHRPIVEQVIKDGMPGVRAAIEKQNAEAKAAGKPEIDSAPILAIAEKNLAKARLAEWRDRADAALESVSELDLRDLRSVVVAGNDLARDQESREVADRLKASLDERVEADHAQWLSDLEIAISEGRVVRALRLSSRPVKAGAPLPSDLASTLAGQASEALAPDVGQERWATVLDALAFSPVRGAVTPLGLPGEPRPELVEAIKRLADRLPAIAELFSIDPATVTKPRRRRARKEPGRRSEPVAKSSSGPAKSGDGKPKRTSDAAGDSASSPERPPAPAAAGAAEAEQAGTQATTTQPTTEPGQAADGSTDSQATAEPAAKPEQAAAEPTTDSQATAEPAAGPEPAANEPTDAHATAEPAAEPEPAANEPTDTHATAEPAAEPEPAANEPTDTHATAEPAAGPEPAADEPTDAHATAEPAAGPEPAADEPTDSQASAEPAIEPQQAADDGPQPDGAPAASSAPSAEGGQGPSGGEAAGESIAEQPSQEQASAGEEPASGDSGQAGSAEPGTNGGGSGSSGDDAVLDEERQQAVDQVEVGEIR